VFERTLTFLNCIDEDKHDKRQFRLDRIESASLVAG
jgi:predicted DNA-binding transcriptional regulator YafY